MRIQPFFFFFCCTGSSLLHEGFLQLWQAGFTLQLGCMGFSLRWLLLLRSTGSRPQRLQQLWCSGLVALWHVGSSPTRDQTSVPCIARLSLKNQTLGSPPSPLVSCASYTTRQPEIWCSLMPMCYFTFPSRWTEAVKNLRFLPHSLFLLCVSMVLPERPWKHQRAESQYGRHLGL